MYLNIKNWLILLMWCQELLTKKVLCWSENCQEPLFNVIIAPLVLLFVLHVGFCRIL